MEPDNDLVCPETHDSESGKVPALPECNVGGEIAPQYNEIDVAPANTPRNLDPKELLRLATNVSD